MVRCQQCQAEVAEGSKFCNRCGARLVVTCSSCHGDNPPGSRFCRHCGAKIAEQATVAGPPARAAAPAPAEMEAERRIVAVIFADIVGSTPMAEALDPEEFRSVMNTCFAVLTEPISRYGGIVDKFIGDCIMALFGAPRAHENDAERAVRAALDMQSAANSLAKRIKLPLDQPLRLRIGINSGLVIAGEVGSEIKRDYTAMGRVVNVAERLQKLCEPGSVLVSDSVFKSTSRLFEYEEKGQFSVKGVAERISVYRVLSARPGRLTMRGLEEIGYSVFIDRQAELEELKAVLERALAGNATVLAIEGPAGIGKSRLVAKFERLSEDAGVKWFWSRCLEYQRSVPYAPVVELAKEMLGLLPEQGPVPNQMLVEALGRLGVEADSRVLTGLSLIFGGGAGAEALGTEETQRCIYDALDLVVGRLLEEGPVALVVDDLHWCDLSSLEWLSHALSRFASSRFLLCVPYRTEARAAWDGLKGARVVRVGRLSQRDALRLIISILDKGEDYRSLSRIRRLVLARSDGNPLYAEEMIKLLVDSGVLVRKRGIWKVVGEAKEAKLPESLRGMMMARVDRLPALERKIVQMLSVLGQGAPFEILLGILGSADVRQTQNALSDLIEAEIVSQQVSDGSPSYSFARPFLQDAVYESLLKRKRRELHLKAAALWEERLDEQARERPALLAYHYERAGQFDKAFTYTRQAARQAARLFATSDAIRLYSESLKLLRLWQEEPDAKESLTIMNELARLYYITGQVARSIDVLQEQIEIAHKSSDTLFLARAFNNIGILYEHLGQWDVAQTHFAQAATIAQRIGRKPLQCSCLINLGTVQLRVGSADAARRSFEESCEIAKSVSSAGLEFEALVNLAMTKLYLLDMEDAKRLQRQAEQLAAKLDDDENRAWAFRTRGEIELTLGRAVQAKESFESYLRLAEKLEATDLCCAASVFLGETERILGLYPAAMAAIRRALGLARRSGHLQRKVEALGCLCRVFLDEGKLCLAQKVAAVAADEAGQFGGHHSKIATRLDRVECAVALGDVVGAKELLAEAEELIELSGLRVFRPRLLILEAASALLAGRAEEGLNLAQECERLCRDSDLKLWLAAALCKKAQALLCASNVPSALSAARSAQQVVAQALGIAQEGSGRFGSLAYDEACITVAQCATEAQSGWPGALAQQLEGIARRCPSAVRSAKALCLLGCRQGEGAASISLLEAFAQRTGEWLGTFEEPNQRRGALKGAGLDWFVAKAVEIVGGMPKTDRSAAVANLLGQLG